MRSCHLLYIEASDRKALVRARAALEATPVLTVADASDVDPRPAMINLLVENGRLAFDIDAQAARQVGIKISSRLLRLARKVY